VFTDQWEDGLRFAKLSSDVSQDLGLAVSEMTSRAKKFISGSEEHHPRLEMLVESLTSAAKKTSNSQEPLPDLRILFGITARFYLEAHGYLSYHVEYIPRLLKRTRPAVDTNVIGVWATHEEVCADYHQMGIPVWWLRHATEVSYESNRFVKYTKARIYQHRPRCPEDGFRDDGIAKEDVVLFQQGFIDTSVLIKEINSWARKQTEENRR
jgi:hypothetical protein